MADEQAPNASVVVDIQRQMGWGANVLFRYWIEGVERPPLTNFQADHLAAALRHVAELIRQRSLKPSPETEPARLTMEIAERAAEVARREWEAVAVKSIKGAMG